MEDQNTYKTKDIYLAATLVSSGFEVKKLEKIDWNFYFIFDKQSHIDPKITIDNFVDKYWSGNLLVNAKLLFSNFRELKNRLYNQ